MYPSVGVFLYYGLEDDVVFDGTSPTFIDINAWLFFQKIINSENQYYVK